MFDYKSGLVLTSSSIFQVVLILLIFIILIIGAYYTTRLTGRVRANVYTNNNIQIVEATMVGPQKSLQLVKVGTEYFLIAVTKDNVSLISKIGKDTIDFSKEKHQSETFREIINNMTKKNK